MNHQELKSVLLANCYDYIAERKERILTAIANIKDSLFDEGKSTAGDKHHTNRAMLQIERENSGNQLIEVEKLENILSKIDIEHVTEIIHLGSLVVTKEASYFISISVGAVTVEDKSYYCISPKSPIGLLLLGKKKGATFSFNDKTVIIEEIN